MFTVHSFLEMDCETAIVNFSLEIGCLPYLGRGMEVDAVPHMIGMSDCDEMEMQWDEGAGADDYRLSM